MSFICRRIPANHRDLLKLLASEQTHARGLFIFDGLDVVQKLHLFTYTSPCGIQPTRRPLPFPWILLKFIPLFPA